MTKMAAFWKMIKMVIFDQDGSWRGGDGSHRAGLRASWGILAGLGQNRQNGDFGKSGFDQILVKSGGPDLVKMDHFWPIFGPGSG